MKSYADDLPNADTVIRAIQEENNNVVAKLLTHIHEIKNDVHSEFTDARASRNEDISRIDELIRQIRIINEEHKKATSWTTTMLILIFLLQIGTFGSLVYYLYNFGINL